MIVARTTVGTHVVVVPEKDKGRDGQDVMALQNRNKVIET